MSFKEAGWRMKFTASTRTFPPAVQGKTINESYRALRRRGGWSVSSVFCETWIPYKIHKTKPVEMAVGPSRHPGIHSVMMRVWPNHRNETQSFFFFFGGGSMKPFWEGEPGSLGYGDVSCFFFSAGKFFRYKLTQEFKILWIEHDETRSAAGWIW